MQQIYTNSSLIQALKESGFGCWFKRYYMQVVFYLQTTFYYCLPRCLSYGACYLCVMNFQFSGNYRLIVEIVMYVVLVLCCLFHVNWSYIGNCTMNWYVSFKYLGVIILGGVNLTVDVDFNKKKFLSTAYGLFHRIGGLSQEIQLSANNLAMFAYSVIRFRMFFIFF